MKSIFLLSFIISSFLFGKSSLINVNFKDLSLFELTQIVAKKTNKNILVTEELKGKINFISKKKISKNDLFNLLENSLNDNGYKLIKYNSYYKIVKSDQKNIKNKNISYITKIISLMNVNANHVINILKDFVKNKNYKDKKPIITLDSQNNSIIINGSKKEVLELYSLVQKLDVEKSQVYVKAKIIEINDDLVSQVGFKLGLLGGKLYSGGILSFASSLNNGYAFPLDVSSIGIDIPNLDSAVALGASLNLLNKTYALSVLSEPSILCINNKESEIYVGETVSIQTGSTVTDGGNSKIEYERQDIGLSLKVKPRISKDKVLLNISTTVENIKNQNDNISYTPETSKKQVKTTAIVNNGESVILGGLIENKIEKTLEKVPLISDVPLIGELFKNKSNISQSKDLVVIITPYIIPKNKSISFIRKEISKLNILEDKFLEKVLLKLKEKKKNHKLSEKKKKTLSNAEKHKLRLKKYFGI